MADKAVDGKIARYPKQSVREGRGVAGYTGKVQVYETRRSLAAAGKNDNEKAEARNEGKLEADKLTRAQLESIGIQRGLTSQEMESYQSKAELVAAIEALG